MHQNRLPLVSVIIVNWNSKAFLRKCLDKLFSNEEKVLFEVIVIDNASNDGTSEMVEKEFPDVRFFQLSENLGFAGANNLASKKAQGQVLLFLNPDTEPSPGTLGILAEIVIKEKEAGAAGCLLLNSDGSVQLSSLMPFPTITNEILDNEFLIKLFKNSDFWGVKALFSKQKIEMTPVKVISGACLAVKKDDFDTIGGFSEDYFMYSEDVDLCFRLHKLGKTNLYTNRCTVVHHGGGSAKQHPVSAFSTKMMLESKKKYFRKNHGPFYAFLFCIAIMLVSLARLILITISFPAILGRGFTRLKNMYRKWAISLLWSCSNLREW
ncbi:MAG: glycosyltransferase family 2 protein [Clostridiales bacterium]|jgi:N-acetylglucosaminyl-diphospho-decaprenol L-rhamnosyltransferase|nr:glycosyltransferase family 2 protein [Clostridiales bacterium]